MHHNSPAVLGVAVALSALSSITAGWGGGSSGSFHHSSFPGFSQSYPYGYPYPIFLDDLVVSLRLQVAPREALVYVDGWAAGIVDDYDGAFQKLRLVPGPHEIVIYHPGHHTFRRNVDFNPGSAHTIRRKLDALEPGEASEPRPVQRPLPPGAAPLPQTHGPRPACVAEPC